MIDAWTIGVKIAMSSNAAAVLGVIQKDLFGLQKQTNLLTGNLTAMKVAAVGAMGAIAGVAALRGMWSLVDAGKEFVHQQALMREAGVDNENVAKATAQAWQTAKDVLTSNAADNMKSLRELRMVFGEDKPHSIDEAIANLTNVTKAQSVMEAVRGKGSGDQVYDMAKALEIKGVSMDPAHFQAMLDMMVAAAIASGGKVLGSDFLNTFKYGRTATQGWNDRFVSGILPTLIQELKSSGGSGSTGGPGNGLMSVFQAVVGGVMSNKAEEQFDRLGLIDHKKVIRTTTGSVKGLRPGAVRGSALFQSDPYEWTQKVLMPALKAQGITSPDAIREAISHLFTNRTAQQMVTLMATMQQRFEKDESLIHEASGKNAYDTLIQNDPTMKLRAFHEAWSNLLTALGLPIVDTATAIMMKVTHIFNDMGQWAAAHPELVGTIEKVAAATAAFLVVLGGSAVVAAAISALGALAAPAIGLAAVAAGVIALADGIKYLAGMFPSISWIFGAAAPGGPNGSDAFRPHANNRGGVQHVVVDNAHEVGGAAAQGTLLRINRGLNGAQSGPTSSSTRIAPFGSDLMPVVP